MFKAKDHSTVLCKKVDLLGSSRSFLAWVSNLLFLTTNKSNFLYAFYKSTFGLDLLEDKDPNKSRPSVDLKVNPEAKDYSKRHST